MSEKKKDFCPSEFEFMEEVEIDDERGSETFYGRCLIDPKTKEPKYHFASVEKIENEKEMPFQVNLTEVTKTQLDTFPLGRLKDLNITPKAYNEITDFEKAFVLFDYGWSRLGVQGTKISPKWEKFKTEKEAKMFIHKKLKNEVE